LIKYLFSENKSIRESVRLKLSALSARYPGTDALVVPAQGQFSRALALDMGTRMCANNDLVIRALKGQFLVVGLDLQTLKG
jgi:hypothetical protein